MRRSLLALALPLLLVFAQQGAMLHELSHIYRTDAPRQRYEETLVQGKLCQACLAFEQIANPASGATAVPISISVAGYSIPAPEVSIAAAQVPIPHSRGPPRV